MDPDVETSTDAQTVRLLELLATDAPVDQLASVNVPARARELALRIRGERDAHRHREAALHALVDTARELSSETEAANVLEAIVRRARTLLGTDIAYLTRYDAEVGDTYMRATSGSVSAAFQSLRLALGAGLGGLVASTRKPYWTADYAADERFAHTADIDGAVGEEGIIAICGTPLLVDDTFVGVLFAANRSPRPFTRDEVALLGNLATLAAVTLVQARAREDAATAFAALTEAHETVRTYAAGVEKAAAAHDRFASLVLDGGGVDDITHALGELLGGWAVLLDETGTPRSTYGRVPTGDTPAPPWAAFLTDEPPRRLDERDGVLGVPVAAGRESLGTLCVGGVDGLPDADRRTLERAAVVTALVLLFERSAADARQSARDRVVSDLLAGRGATDERLRLARASGLDPRRPFCVLVLRTEVGPSSRSVLLGASTLAGDGALVGQHEGDVVALVPGTDPDTLAREFAVRLGRRSPVTVAGVGPVTGVDDLGARYVEGVRTVGALVALGHRGTGAAATQLGFAGLIVGSDPDVAAYVTRVLGPVIDYDARRGTDLLATLGAYFAAGGSPRHAATQLHVHVNTVSQRLERIGALLGDSWQDPDRSLEIQLALRLRRLVAAP